MSGVPGVANAVRSIFQPSNDQQRNQPKHVPDRNAQPLKSILKPARDTQSIQDYAAVNEDLKRHSNYGHKSTPSSDSTLLDSFEQSYSSEINSADEVDDANPEAACATGSSSRHELETEPKPTLKATKQLPKLTYASALASKAPSKTSRVPFVTTVPNVRANTTAFFGRLLHRGCQHDSDTSLATNTSPFGIHGKEIDAINEEPNLETRRWLMVQYLKTYKFLVPGGGARDPRLDKITIPANLAYTLPDIWPNKKLPRVSIYRGKHFSNLETGKPKRLVALSVAGCFFLGKEVVEVLIRMGDHVVTKSRKDGVKPDENHVSVAIQTAQMRADGMFLAIHAYCVDENSTTLTYATSAEGGTPRVCTVAKTSDGRRLIWRTGKDVRELKPKQLPDLNLLRKTYVVDSRMQEELLKYNISKKVVPNRRALH